MNRIAAACFVVAAGALAAWWVGWRPPRPDDRSGTVLMAAPREVERLVPQGTRVRVEVLNTSDVRGLARKATFYLRDAGFDVVRFAGEGPARESTLVLDRSGHLEWARWAGKALGGARVESIPDSSRYVDVTILLGRTWRPPSQPLYP